MTQTQKNTIKMYELPKITIQLLIKSNFHLTLSIEEEKQYIIKQQETPLFRQMNIVRDNDSLQMHEFILVEAKHNKKREDKLRFLLEEGFTYNGVHYSRFGKSASQAKDGITVFVQTDHYDEIMERSQLGVTPDKEVISKYESYRNLILSSCQTVEKKLPYIVIVDEYEKTIENQYIRYVILEENQFTDKNTGEIKTGKLRRIKEGYKDIEISPFDGFGVHSRKVSRMINKGIGNKSNSVLFQIRLPMMKGVTVEMDFKRFYRERNVEKIQDVFGKWHDVKDIDCIWNTSMWKGYKLFKGKFGVNAWDEYLDRINKYEFQLGISKFNHNMDDIEIYSRMNFQYLQCLDLMNPKYLKKFKERDYKYNILDSNNVGKMIDVAKYSTDLMEKIIKGDKLYTMKFLGMINTEKYDPKSKYTEAIMINENMLRDPSIKKMLRRNLEKTITEMKFGKIYTKGFYHTVIGDVIGYLEYSAGLEVKGTLKAGEFHANTLEDGYALSMRSPLVDPSEVNRVKLVHTDDTNKYIRHLYKKDICMINMHDLTQQQQGGMDQDGDVVFLCNDEILVDSKIDLPIVVDTEDKATAKPVEYNMENIINYECNSRDSRIGEITNIATSLLNQYTEDSKWKRINADNAALMRLYQGKEIDFLKTGTRWIITKNLRKYLKKIPHFLLYNYPVKLNTYNKIARLNKDKNKEEKRPNNAYHSPSPMNELSEYINEWEKRKIHWDNSVVNNSHLVVNKDLDLSDREIMKMIKNTYDEFNKELRTYIEEEKDVESLKDNFYYKLKCIVSNENDLLANYCIKTAYKSINRDKTLCWMLFGDVILDNLRKNSHREDGSRVVKVDRNDPESQEFLGRYYKLENIE